MFTIRKNVCRSIFSQRLSIFSGHSFKISSISNSKRHRSHPSSLHRHDSSKNAHQTNTLRRLFQPIDVKPMVANNPLSNNTNANIGQELTGGKTLERNALLKVITDFYRRDEIKKLSAEHGLDLRLFQDAYVSFRKFCIQSTVLPVDLHIVLSDIISGSGKRNNHRVLFFLH